MALKTAESAAAASRTDVANAGSTYVAPRDWASHPQPISVSQVDAAARPEGAVAAAQAGLE
jgi:hypothetical protein